MKRRIFWLGFLLACLGCHDSADDPTDDPTALEADPNVHAESEPAATSATLAELNTAIQALREGGGNDSWAKRLAAIRHIGPFGPKAKPALPALRTAMDDPNWQVRSEAVCVLALVDLEDIRHLRKGLDDRDWKVRRATAYALGQTTSPLPRSMRLLREAFADPYWPVRSEAVRSLAAMGPRAVSDLRTALGDPDSRVVVTAAWSVRQLGATAKAAIPELQKALDHEDWHVRSAAVYALGRMGPESVPDVLKALEDHDWSVRSAAQKSLEGLGPKSQPALIQALKHEKEAVRTAVSMVLGRTPPKSGNGAVVSE